jgi:hypothetical protein
MNEGGAMRRKAFGVLLSLVVALGVGCDGGQGSSGERGTEGPQPDLAGPNPLPLGSEPVNLDPADFGGPIDNEYWPMAVGNRWVYRESAPDGSEQKVVVTVTDETREIQGIEATVVHDVVSEDGEVTEDTFDWYAQDRWGNIWYMGEDTKEFENGKVVSTAGSWEAGVDGAQAGIIMPANPQPGMVYQQEYYEGEAEDVGAVLSLHEMAQVPFGFFRDALLTKDTTPLEPRVQEYKLYAKGVGPVLVLGVSGGADREDLISFEEG